MLYLIVLIPLILACFMLFLPHKIVRWGGLVVYVGMLAASVYLFIRTRFYNEIITATTGGQGILGITLFCDLTASIFLMLICFLFLCYFFYSAIRDRALERFNFFLTTLQSLLILIILSKDLFNIFIAIEVATIVNSILIMFKKESRSIYDGLVYLLTNNLGMLFFLMGTGLIYRQFGVLDISVISSMMTGVAGRTMLLPFAFIMTGVMLKCAIVPLHMWLPHAHGTPGAPTIVSAILSGLYVKGGIYLFIRMREMFLPAVNMDLLFVIIGVITAFGGIFFAIMQKDIKLILAYHTISQIGLIIFGLCLNNVYAYAGAMLHIINHALFKSLLFLVSGIIIEKYGTRNIREIRGVLKTNPILGFAVIAGILGITGAPLFNGSISKYFILSGTEIFAFELLINLINFGTILSFVKFGQILFGKKQEHISKNDKYSNATLITLGSLCFLTGLLGSPFLYLLLGEWFAINIWEYLLKILIWAVSYALAGFVFYKFIIKAKLNSEFLTNITLNGIGMSLCAFFVIVIVWGFIFV